MKNIYYAEFSSSLLKDEKIILKFFIKNYFENKKVEFFLNELDVPKLKDSKKTL